MTTADSVDGDLGLRPLTARSVLLSILLGNHPPELPVRALVRLADLFGIAEGTTRVALSRLAADGDVVASGGRYRLNPRLVARQRRWDEARHPRTRSWRGAWEVGVVTGGSDPDLAAELEALRLAELKAGVWLRPANLARDWPPAAARRVWRFESRLTEPFGEKDPLHLARALWDLPGWSRQAERLIATLDARSEPAGRFVVAAAIVRHLGTDPLLPAGLLPAGWPGARLRSAYAAYERELAALFRVPAG